MDFLSNTLKNMCVVAIFENITEIGLIITSNMTAPIQLLVLPVPHEVMIFIGQQMALQY